MKTAPAADKKGKQKPPAPPVKSFRKKVGRLLRWFLVLGILGGLAAMIGAYYRWIPISPEWTAKLDPYMEQADPYLAKVNLQRKPAEEAAPGEKPATNFPLVDLDGEKKKTDIQPSASAAPSAATGQPSVASASPAQPLSGPAKPPLKDTTETAKTYGKLAKLYGAMKAEEAAAVFHNLEDEQVVMILSRMDDESAAKVLSSMEPKRAARLTQAMIKRK